MTPSRQLDLFSARGALAEAPEPAASRRRAVAPGDLDDRAVIAAIPGANLAEAQALTAEAARRRLRAAIPALEALCSRFAGFGVERSVSEQAAALSALSVIGGVEAAQTIARMIVRGVVQGPTLKDAVAAAAQLNARLPTEIVLALLRQPDPDVRADACRCFPGGPDTIAVLIDLLDDLHANVRVSAAYALGRLGRREARPILTRLLREAPTMPVIDALPAIADEECIVLLGRIARARPDLRASALEALEEIDDPRAAAIVARMR